MKLDTILDQIDLGSMAICLAFLFIIIPLYSDNIRSGLQK